MIDDIMEDDGLDLKLKKVRFIQKVYDISKYRIDDEFTDQFIIWVKYSSAKHIVKINLKQSTCMNVRPVKLIYLLTLSS